MLSHKFFPLHSQVTIPASAAANPLLVFSSLLDWGEEGRYSAQKVLDEEQENIGGIRDTENEVGVSGQVLSKTTDRSDIEVRVMDDRTIETCVKDDGLVKFAVSSVTKTWKRAQKICRRNLKKGKGSRTEKISFVQHVKKQHVVDGKVDKMKRKEEVSRNLFSGMPATSTSCTPHILDQYRLPQDLLQDVNHKSRAEQLLSRNQVPAAQHKCDVCGRIFSQLSSVRRHKQAGCCTAAGSPRLGQDVLGRARVGERKRLQLEEGEMVIMVWEPEDRILAEVEKS